MNEVDLVVVGAGPAGCAAAIVAASSGARVILLEARAWPRGKVCGNCIAPDGVDRLAAFGVRALALPSAVALTTLWVHAGGTSAEIPLTPGGVAVPRDVLDAALVDRALAAGAAFHHSWRVDAIEVEGHRVRVSRSGSSESITASRVVLASGLARAIPGLTAPLLPRVRCDALLGLGATTVPSLRVDLPRGQIRMHVHRAGYVGMVRLGDGRVTLAASIRPGFIRASGSVGAAVADILGDARGPWRELDWMGTPKLTRSARRVVDGPIALAGDARAFVEPFTGEGIAWALASGSAAGAWALDRPGIRAADRALAMRRWRCRVTAIVLRASPLVRAALALTRLTPGLADRVVRGRSVRGRRAELSALPGTSA